MPEILLMGARLTLVAETHHIHSVGVRTSPVVGMRQETNRRLCRFNILSCTQPTASGDCILLIPCDGNDQR